MRLNANKLKELIKKQAKGNSTRSQIIMRNYIMERFLERIAVSEYKDNFILKGGMLIASIVGLDTRATLDIDTTVKNLPLSVVTAKEIISKIIVVPIEDGVSFTIKDVSVIMDDAEYSGVRASLTATLENTRTPLKIDISTGDAITPKEVSYNFKLMFENRTIPIWSYNLETVLAEKLETVLSRGTANTRLRNLYDIYILQSINTSPLSQVSFKAAFLATCRNRSSQFILAEGLTILQEIKDSPEMQQLWSNYQKKYDYASGIAWEDTIIAAKALLNFVFQDYAPS
jgi:predicted nucleotidyltransferase component of viral defense system